MSGQRHCARPRCEDCGLHPALCLCAMRPQIDLPVSLTVVQHRREKNKPTNSVRPLRSVLGNTKLIHYAVRGETFDETALVDSSQNYLLLFPDPDPEHPAPPCTLGAQHTLVVLDGTWAQCSRMRRRIAALSSMPTVSLPARGGSVWGIRHTLDPARVCTFEAVAGALIHHGYPEQGEAMLTYFAQLAKRMQLMRGTARVEETSLSPDAYRAYIEDVNTPRPDNPNGRSAPLVPGAPRQAGA